MKVTALVRFVLATWSEAGFEVEQQCKQVAGARAADRQS
jgi:hypothetical protein